jgi:hypothetical protein
MVDYFQDLQTKNIELGAGCSSFGKFFFAPCYLTTKDEQSVRNCLDSHQIDCFCDAHQVPCPNSRFENVYICNPFDYGFKDKKTTTQLMNELFRILNQWRNSISHWMWY